MMIIIILVFHYFCSLTDTVIYAKLMCTHLLTHVMHTHIHRAMAVYFLDDLHCHGED